MPAPTEDATALRTLREVAREFFSRPGPRLIATAATVTWGLRALAGKPALGDLAAAVGVFAWWPLQEWLAHRYLLHYEPRREGDDLYVARKHRAHHRAPESVPTILLPVGVIAGAIPVSAAFFWLALPSRRTALTAMAAYSTMALAYEWTHLLVHTGVQPEGAFYARVRRNHWLHHFRNENYWLGFTLPWVDTLLGTEPDPRAVPQSPTARDLYGRHAQGLE